MDNWLDKYMAGSVRSECSQAIWPNCRDWLPFLSTQPPSFVWLYAMFALAAIGAAGALARPRIDRNRRHRGSVALFWVFVVAGVFVFFAASLISTNTLNF